MQNYDNHANQFIQWQATSSAPTSQATSGISCANETTYHHHHSSTDLLAAYLSSHQAAPSTCADLNNSHHHNCQQHYIDQCQQQSAQQQYYYATTTTGPAAVASLENLASYQVSAVASNCDNYAHIYQDYSVTAADANTTTAQNDQQQILQYTLHHQPIDNHNQVSNFEQRQNNSCIKQVNKRESSGNRVVNKVQHNKIERRRRFRIKSCCDTLRVLVPGLTAKADKARILEQTVKYLEHINKCPAAIKCHCDIDIETDISDNNNNKLEAKKF